MSAFLDPLCLTEIDDSIFAVCDHPYRYQSDLARRVFTVPVDFYTDFASVPRLGALYALLGNCAHQPAVIHDWLYYTAIVDRGTADAVLMEAMGAIALPFWRRYPIYWGVRLGGMHAWNEHRRKGDPLSGRFKDNPDVVAKYGPK